MSEHADASTLHEVRGTFARSDQMQDAVGRLNLSGFDRAEISMPATLPGATLGDRSEPVSTNEDAHNLRILGSSTAASVAALAAAGVTIATGGAAIPALAAAALAGGAAGGGVLAAHGSADNAEQDKRDARAADGSLILAVRTSTQAKRQQAEQILHEAGATSVETIG